MEKVSKISVLESENAEKREEVTHFLTQKEILTADIEELLKGQKYK